MALLHAVPLAEGAFLLGFGNGLLGAFIVEPKDKSKWPEFDREYTMVLNDGPIGGFSINGKGFPATQPLVAKKGEKILVRYMNEGLMIHPMHLHGMPQLVVAQDGWALPQPYMCDTVNIAPGQRFDAFAREGVVDGRTHTTDRTVTFERHKPCAFRSFSRTGSLPTCDRSISIKPRRRRCTIRRHRTGRR